MREESQSLYNQPILPSAIVWDSSVITSRVELVQKDKVKRRYENYYKKKN